MAYVNCLTLRGIKGSALTHGELDNNFLCLDTAISSLNNYVSTAKKEVDVINLNHYTNLQPLCSKINRDLK